MGNIDLVDITGQIDSFMYTYILVFLLIIAGVMFCIRTRFVQFRLVKDMLKSVTEKKHNDSAKSVSSFQALMVSTASRVGTGNIAGVATAIAAGGPGAIFWMWIMATIGSASAFIESTLAQIFKVKTGEGGYRGGPAYYIEQGLGKRWLGIVFSISLILCFALGFNGLQAYNLTSVFEYYVPTLFAGSPVRFIIAGMLTLATAAVLFGGGKRISVFTSIIVPIMAIGYLAISLFVTFTNLSSLPRVFEVIFQSAFDVQSIFGGFAGSVVTIGIKRGLFSNEAGMGSAPNAAASASVSHPVKQGLVQTLSVFIDTMIICTCTAMMVMVFYVNNDAADLNGMPLVQAAANFQLGQVGILFITIAVVLFAYSSIMGNYYYAESNMRFISKSDGVLFGFRVLCCIVVFMGCMMSFDLAWNLADIFMGIMAIINLIAIFLLGKYAIAALKDYEAQRAQNLDPVFEAASIEGLPEVECWHYNREQLEEEDALIHGDGVLKELLEEKDF